MQAGRPFEADQKLGNALGAPLCLCDSWDTTTAVGDEDGVCGHERQQAFSIFGAQRVDEAARDSLACHGRRPEWGLIAAHALLCAMDDLPAGGLALAKNPCYFSVICLEHLAQ